MSADPENQSPAQLAENDREEQERKAREVAEQAQLPYKWTQTIRDLDVTAPIPTNIKGRDMEVELTKTKIRIAIKGQTPIIEVRRMPFPASCADTIKTHGNVLIILLLLCATGRIRAPHYR